MSSVEAIAYESLFLELALRGYDLSKLREEETTAEIVKFNTWPLYPTDPTDVYAGVDLAALGITTINF